MQARNVQNQQLAAQLMQQGQMDLQASMAQLRQQQQFIMQAGDIIKAGQAHRMAAQEQNVNAMDNIIAGNIDLRGPTGQVYNVTNDYQPRHWIDGLGRCMGEDGTQRHPRIGRRWNQQNKYLQQIVKTISYCNPLPSSLKR